MPYGPVASFTYDLLKRDALALEEAGEFPVPINVEEISGRPHVTGERPANLNKFSKSDIKALEYAVSKYGHLDFAGLCDVTHTDPAYIKAKKRGNNSSIQYEDLIENSENKEMIIQDIREMAQDIVF